MNESSIWTFLKKNGFSDCGAAGLMGNMYAESGLSPINLQNTYNKSLGMTDEQYTEAVDNGTYQNFVQDKAGYGLVQWTFWSRKQGVLDYAKSTNRSIGNLDMQLEYVVKELQAFGLLNALKNAASVKDASNMVLLQFEKPADMSERVQEQRAGFAQVYYDKFAAQASSGEGGKKMSNSPLTEVTVLSPNHSGTRAHAIDRISPHCVVGQCSAEALGAWFAKSSTKASSNYGIDKDGRVGLYVDESNRSWCTSSSSNDNRAVTIECASDTYAPYRMNDAVYATLVKLCADICRRNGKTKLLWFDDKEKTLAYNPAADEMVITVHRWFANKSCPGDWLYSRLGNLANEVTALLGGAAQNSDDEEDEDMTLDRFKELMQEYRKELQDNDCGNWSAEAREWAISSGMINGIGNDANGNPNYAWADTLTREQAAALFYRFAKLMGRA